MSERSPGEKSFAIHLEHRPRRIAFAVDLGQEAEKILRGILRFNLRSWGGRHNPIVPLFNGKVPEAYYPLLDVADPDVFYVFGELEGRELDEIHQRYSPTLVLKHFLREPINEHTYDVQLREQADISKYLVNLRDKLRTPFRHLEPCLLQLQGSEEHSLSSFFMWNFGYTSANFFAIQNHNLKGCRPTSLSDHDLLEMLRNERNLAWSINICGDAPLKRTAGDSWRYYFPIFYGTSPFNIVAYWNDGLTTGPNPIAGEIRQLWLTPEVVNDESSYKSLVELPRSRVRSATQQPRLKMYSCDISQEELEWIGKRLSQDVRGGFYYGDSLNFQPTQLAIPVQPRRVVSFLPRKGEIEYATGSEIHLAPMHPPEIEENSDQC